MDGVKYPSKPTPLDWNQPITSFSVVSPVCSLNITFSSNTLLLHTPKTASRFSQITCSYIQLDQNRKPFCGIKLTTLCTLLRFYNGLFHLCHLVPPYIHTLKPKLHILAWGIFFLPKGFIGNVHMSDYKGYCMYSMKFSSGSYFGKFSKWEFEC